MRDGVEIRAARQLATDDGVRESTERVHAKTTFGFRAQLLVCFNQLGNSFEFRKEYQRDTSAGFFGVIQRGAG
jgi:hypothetical protein